MRGLILAAGLGTRLLPLTLWRAKPAIPFLNRPIINYTLDALRSAGVNQIVVNLHHLPETVLTAVGAAPDVLFSWEPAIQGTAGAIGKVRGSFASEPLILCNGKIFFEQDLGDVIRFHKENGNWVTLVLVPYQSNEPFAPVSIDEEQNVVGFGLKGSRQTDLRYIFTGVHVLSPEVYDFIPEGPCDTVRDVYPRLMADRRPVRAFVSQAPWSEISTPGRYLSETMRVLESRRLPVLSPEPVSVSARGLVAGEDVQIGPNCRLENSIIWDNVDIGSNVTMQRCVVTSCTRLPPSSEFRDAIITPVPRESGREIANRGARRAGDLVIWPLK